MVENCAEKANECLLNRGRRVLFAYNRDSKNCPLYGVPAIQGLLNYWSEWKDSWHFQRIVHYIVGVHCWGVSFKQDSNVSCTTVKPSLKTIAYVKVGYVILFPKLDLSADAIG